MNDKCSAGTGKFLEIMANRLGVTIAELFDLAEQMKSETEKWKKYKLTYCATSNRLCENL